MNMMKDRKIATRAVGLILILALLLASCVAFAEDDDSKGVEFEAKFTDCLKVSPREWFSTSFNRAMLTFLLSMDISLVVDESEFVASESIVNRSYVARSGEVLSVYLHGEKQDCLILYSPTTGEATYVMSEVKSDSAVKAMLSVLFEDGYYENNLLDIAEAARAIGDALS